MKRKPIFMVHKHHATHLHYDLRIEIEGKLKSWALREIPIKPSNAILAIQVADHPFWYRHFEGVIPEGKYGAGPVMVWDKGLFNNVLNNSNSTTERSTSTIEGLKKGILFLFLEGHKLKGEYVLIRISKKQRWLFLKLNDSFVLHGRKPNNWNNSIKSGKTLKQIRNFILKNIENL